MEIVTIMKAILNRIWNLCLRYGNRIKKSATMNHNQIEIITGYLKMETSYALIISGAYGIGKTYFFKNILSPKIVDISILKDEKIKYIPIHISLFGLKSIEEIQTAIFLEIYPLLKNRKLKIAGGISKLIIRGASQFTNLGNIDDYLEDVNEISRNTLDYKNLVICFDDIDRKSSGLKLQDLFGFINSMVEIEGAKIFIIANEHKLSEEESEEYHKFLKEKTIGVEVRYIPNVEEVFLNIIKTKYKSPYRIYYDFLIEKKDRILEVLGLNQNNFRALIFFMEHFYVVFGHLIIEFQDDTKFAIRKKEKLDSVFNFAISISFEYKLGLLDASEISGLVFQNFRLINEESQDLKISHRQNFLEKYFSNTDYIPYEIVSDYITGTRGFKIKELKNKLSERFDSSEIPDHLKLLKEVEYWNVLQNLTDEEYRKKINEMLTYVDKGKYPLIQYPIVFQTAMQFDNLLDFDVDELMQRIKRGIEKGLDLSSFEYHRNLSNYLNMSNYAKEIKDEIQEISQYIIDINEKIYDDKIKNLHERLFQLFLSEPSRFYHKLRSQNYLYLEYEPFLMNFNPKRFADKIDEMENEDILEFSAILTKRKNTKLISDEINFFSGLLGELESNCKNVESAKSIRKFVISSLINTLREIIEFQQSGADL